MEGSPRVEPSSRFGLWLLIAVAATLAMGWHISAERVQELCRSCASLVVERGHPSHDVRIGRDAWAVATFGLAPGSPAAR